jgi:DNA-binding transcriptional LysR family regulator
MWAAFSRPAAEQRIRRFLQTPGHPTLQHAAKRLRIRTELLVSQITQLERAVGATLLDLDADHRDISLTPEGERFVREVASVLQMLDQSRRPVDNAP